MRDIPGRIAPRALPLVLMLTCVSGWPAQGGTGESMSPAAERIIAVKADRIDTVAGGVIQNGTILIRGAKISEIGAEVKVPGDAEIIEASDKIVFPGLISPVSTLGLSGGQGGGPQSQARYRVADELYPYQHEYQRALQAGFTTLGLVPRGQGIAGQGAIVRPVGASGEEMLVTDAGILWVGFRADEKAKKIIKSALDAAKGKEDSGDPGLTPLARALQGQIPTFLACPRPADTLHLLDLLKEYDKMKLVLVAGRENYRVADRLVRAKIPAIVPAAIGFEFFTRNRINEPDLLAEAGVKIACTPAGDGIEDHEDFRRQMAELVKCGLDPEIARKAMTIHPAEALGIDYRVGSLEKGKDANLLILDGDILDATTTIHKVMIEGKIVYENPWGKTR